MTNFISKLPSYFFRKVVAADSLRPGISRAFHNALLHPSQAYSNASAEYTIGKHVNQAVGVGDKRPSNMLAHRQDCTPSWHHAQRTNKTGWSANLSWKSTQFTCSSPAREPFANHQTDHACTSKLAFTACLKICVCVSRDELFSALFVTRKYFS